ncbi:hypothetical protein BH09MYX1_BH09MYX1_67070 [soil metagenome]
MEAALLSVFFGLFAGVRHAMEPDHLAAVSTLVAGRKSSRQTFGYAATWGLGHAAVLLLVGGVLFALKCAMPPRLAVLFELGVAVMLVVLGVRSLLASRRPHGEHAHAHTISTKAKPAQPFLVGTVHGLAGSGALVAIAMTKATSLAGGLGFLLVYGVGAMAGMAMLAGVAGVPLARLARHPKGTSVLLAVTGVLCVATGLGWGLPMIPTLF